MLRDAAVFCIIGGYHLAIAAGLPAMPQRATPSKHGSGEQTAGSLSGMATLQPAEFQRKSTESH
jgi:hypothetical protein